MGTMFFPMLGETGEFTFERPPSEAKACIICFHGFSGSPWETKPVAEHLYQLGFSTYCPLYPAHGIEDMDEAKKAMAQISAELFIKFALELIQEKRKQYKKVYLFGQSLGAILTTYLASQQVADAAAITVGPLGLPRILLWIARFGAKFDINLSTKKPPLESGWSYEFLNARSVSTIFDLIALARANLSQINIPLYGCYSKKDLITRNTPKILEKGVPSRYLKIEWFNKSKHVMPLDCQAQEVIESIGDFFLLQSN